VTVNHVGPVLEEFLAQVSDAGVLTTAVLTIGLDVAVVDAHGCTPLASTSGRRWRHESVTWMAWMRVVVLLVIFHSTTELRPVGSAGRRNPGVRRSRLTAWVVLLALSPPMVSVIVISRVPRGITECPRGRVGVEVLALLEARWLPLPAGVRVARIKVVGNEESVGVVMTSDHAQVPSTAGVSWLPFVRIQHSGSVISVAWDRGNSSTGRLLGHGDRDRIPRAVGMSSVVPSP